MPAAPTGPKSPATLKDLESLPETVVGEIIDGTLYTHPRPLAVHAYVLLKLGGDLSGPFQFGRGGPGGWWILPEPGIQAAGSPEFVPDLAGWRRERLPELPDGRLTVVPDWACEILSPSTRTYDMRTKRPFYARLGLRHLWFIDPEARTLTVSELQAGHWVELGVYAEEEAVRASPFEALELRLGELWPPVRFSP